MFGLGEKTTLNSRFWLKLFCIQFGGDKSFFTFCLKDPRIGCANECKKSLNECCWRPEDDPGSVRPAQPRHRHQALHQVTRAVIRARGVDSGLDSGHTCCYLHQIVTASPHHCAQHYHQPLLWRIRVRVIFEAEFLVWREVSTAIALYSAHSEPSNCSSN